MWLRQERQNTTLVQTDTWLIEDVEHIDELTANLGSKTDALAFTTRE